MEPARLRPAVTIPQRVHDIAERLSTHAKAEIYEVLEGFAPGGDLSSLLRLEPLVNDIVAQLSDGFKQAVTKRLLPEACKLLGSRSSALATSPTWSAGQAPAAQGPGALAVSRQNQLHENDILALGLAPGTGQPFRSDQGPPQDAASAAASSLLLGAAASSQQLSPPASAGSTGGVALHPHESRFAFANPADARNARLGQPPLRSSYGGGGGGGVDAVLAADPLLFLGLGDSSGGLGLGGGDSGSAISNGPATGADPFLLGGGRATASGGGFPGSSASASPSPHAVVRQVAHMSLGGPPGGSAGNGGSSGGSVRPPSSASSSPHPATSPYPSLPLAIRPGSSLDPGLATPPVSLPGTEPLRSAQHQQFQHQQYQQQPQGRLSGAGDMSPLGGGSSAAAPPPPVPLFGGAPGPSPGGSHQQLLRQQQHLMSGALGVSSEAGMVAGGGTAHLANGNGNGAAAYQVQQQQHMQYRQQQQYAGEQQRQQYNLLQQQQLQQQQQLDGSGFAAVSAVRTAYTAAPEGPRASHDGRMGGNYLHNPSELPYEVQMFYGSTSGAPDMHQPNFADRYNAPVSADVALVRGPGGHDSAGATPGLSSDYGAYGLARLGPAAVPGSANGGGGVGLGPPTCAGADGGYLSAAPGSVGRTTSSPATGMMATTTPPGPVGRTSRSGAASAGSVADSRSSSFTGQQGVPRRGSGSGATAPQPLCTAQQSSPPASDASGPSSSASVSTAAVASGVAKSPIVTMSMAAKLQQVASKPVPASGGSGRGKGGAAGAGTQSPGSAQGGAGSSVKAPADMPGRFRCLPPAVQSRIHALTRDNHVVLVKDFDEKVLSKMTLLVDKFGAGECLAMLDRIEEVLKGKAGRLANGPGYLDVSVSTRLDELKQRASGQVTAPEDYARSTLHSRIYAELRDLINRHGFLQWHHFDQGIINMLKKMPNATALERLNELAYHSFKNVDNPKSCIVSIFTTKPKYVNA